MRLFRYLEIEKMLRVKGKGAAPSVPNGYGYGVWHAALRDVCAELEDKKLPGDVAIGRPSMMAGTDGVARRMQRRVDLESLLDEGGEVGPGHVACEFTAEDWRALVLPLFKLVGKPKAESPEIGAAEKIAIEKGNQLDEALKRIAELEADNARLASSALTDPALATPQQQGN